MIHTHHIVQLFPVTPLFSPIRHRRPVLFPSHFPLFSGTSRLPQPATALRPWLAELPELPSPASEVEEAEGPIEIPSSSASSLFAIDENPTPLQTATSVLLTGAITVFLFRSLRRRAKRAKDLRVRSTGVTKVKGLKDEALDSLKAIGVGPDEAKGPPSPVQALLGGITAGVITVILYKFTHIVEAALNGQTISDNFSARQLTITVRTIINGLCYLATFVFGANSVGLILYSIQLAFSSVMDGTKNSSSIKNDVQQSEPCNTSGGEGDSTNIGMPENSDEA